MSQDLKNIGELYVEFHRSWVALNVAIKQKASRRELERMARSLWDTHMSIVTISDKLKVDAKIAEVLKPNAAQSIMQACKDGVTDFMAKQQRITIKRATGETEVVDVQMTDDQVRAVQQEQDVRQYSTIALK